MKIVSEWHALTYSDQQPQLESAQIACGDVDQKAVATDGGMLALVGLPASAQRGRGWYVVWGL